jgi:hypothetical protein
MTILASHDPSVCRIGILAKQDHISPAQRNPADSADEKYVFICFIFPPEYFYSVIR